MSTIEDVSLEFGMSNGQVTIMITGVSGWSGGGVVLTFARDVGIRIEARVAKVRQRTGRLRRMIFVVQYVVQACRLWGLGPRLSRRIHG